MPTKLQRVMISSFL